MKEGWVEKKGGGGSLRLGIQSDDLVLLYVHRICFLDSEIIVIRDRSKSMCFLFWPPPSPDPSWFPVRPLPPWPPPPILRASSCFSARLSFVPLRASRPTPPPQKHVLLERPLSGISCCCSDAPFSLVLIVSFQTAARSYKKRWFVMNCEDQCVIWSGGTTRTTTTVRVVVK